MHEYMSENPVFSDKLPVTDTTDEGHADNINAGPIQAFKNTLCNRENIKKIEEKVEQLPGTTNNLLATEPGSPLDAVQGKTLNDKGSRMAFYVGSDNCLHFKDWEGNDTIVPIHLVASNVEYKTVTFGGAGEIRTIATGGRLPILAVQYFDNLYESSIYYNGDLIRKHNMTAVSPEGIQLQSTWDDMHEFHCYIAYEGVEIEVKSVTFGGAGTTRTITLKKKPRLIVQVNNIPSYSGLAGVWCNGTFRGSSGNMKSVTDTEIIIGSGWNNSYTFECYVVY